MQCEWVEAVEAFRAMNDEGRDGTHAKPCLLIQSAGINCSLKLIILIQLKIYFAAFPSIGSGCV